MIFLGAISVFLMLSMFTYDANDPSWSFTGESGAVANAGGRAGAWLSDVFLRFFGYIAYIFPLMVGYVAYLSYQSEREKPENNRMFITFRSVGFILTLLAGSGLAHIHFMDPVMENSYSAGGILGEIMSDSLVPYFGYTGGTLLLLALFLTGFTWFTGLSWLWLMDQVGHYTWEFFDYAKYKIAEWREQLEARKITQERVKSVKKERKKVSKRKPVKIEPVIQQVETSVRKEKERQTTLFDGPVAGDLPPLDLLDASNGPQHQISAESLEATSRQVELKLADFAIEAQVVAVHPGPVITRFELDLAPGVKVNKIVNLSKDLARALSAISVRIVEVIPGKSVIGLEIPNEQREMVNLSEVVESKAFDDSSSKLSMCLGKDISGQPVVVNLAKMPHLLVAGTTGAGKSVGINAMILSLLYKSTPDDVRTC